jgi:hypothetical protein
MQLMMYTGGVEDFSEPRSLFLRVRREVEDNSYSQSQQVAHQRLNNAVDAGCVQNVRGDVFDIAREQALRKHVLHKENRRPLLG